MTSYIEPADWRLEARLQKQSNQRSVTGPPRDGLSSFAAGAAIISNYVIRNAHERSLLNSVCVVCFSLIVIIIFFSSYRTNDLTTALTMAIVRV